MPNCIPVKELKNAQLTREEARQKLNIPTDCIALASAGRLHPEKDQETMIRAFAQVSAQLKDTQLFIMGQGRLKDSLQELISSLGMSEQIRLLGMIPQGATYFRAFDTFILPSKLEPFGLVIIEAMSAEIPVISSMSGGAL